MKLIFHLDHTFILYYYIRMSYMECIMHLDVLLYPLYSINIMYVWAIYILIIILICISERDIESVVCLVKAEEKEN